jgi:general secretion pathway protein G
VEADVRNGFGRRGVTLIEIAVICAVLGTVVMLAIPKVADWRDRANITRATADIVAIEIGVRAYLQTNGALPASLSDLGYPIGPDPWGHPYQFYNFAVGGDQPRKDRFLNPINSSYDLYSMGKDGRSQRALTAAFSRDDIIRAQDGAFVGLASDF